MNEVRAIIIAAGLGSRLKPLTDDKPKCMLEVSGKPLIYHCIDNLKENGVDHISIVTGYKSEKIDLEGVHYFHNNDYQNNNILHSLLYARDALEQAMNDDVPVVVSYSDLWFHPSIVKALLLSHSDINIVVDCDWERGYVGRTDHPVSEAELAIFAPDKKLHSIGKDLINPAESENSTGEFIGLFMMSPAGIRRFLEHFDKVNAHTSMTSPFQKAAEWQKSYITDIFQDMVSDGTMLICVGIEGNWKEFDTVQDLERGIPV